MCLDKTSAWSPIEFLLVTFLRPLSFSPIMVTAIISGGLFGPAKGALLAVISVTASSRFSIYTRNLPRSSPASALA